MNFRPAYPWIEIKPVKGDSPLGEYDKAEIGEVITIYEGLTRVKVGDIIYFDKWGYRKTTEHNGVEHHLVKYHEDVILGYDTN